MQRNHLHLIVEAESAATLAAAMKGLKVRIARGLNRLMGRHGAVFSDRYHVRYLKSPRQVRNAYVYVLNNDLHHGLARKGRAFDWRSSAPLFDGWREGPPAWPNRFEGPSPVVPARSWLATRGWRRHGEIGVEEVPRIA